LRSSVLLLALAGGWFVRAINRLPLIARLALSAFGPIPHFLITYSTPYSKWWPMVVLAVVPPALVLLIWRTISAEDSMSGIAD
jgi:hypothetical protein